MTIKEAIEMQERNFLVDHDGNTYSDCFEAQRIAIDAMKEVEKHEETFEWCNNCKEYDTEQHCCHRWTKRIRDTLKEQKEYSEKYKWHDLRKNPDDLPEIGYSCMAWFDNADVSCVVRYEDTWVYNEYYGLREMPKEDSDKIIAWREIDLFEEK